MKFNNTILAIAALLSFASCSTNNEADVVEKSESEIVDNVIMTRRSVRQYTDREINRDTLNQILTCGINAPNAMARQAYEIRVIDNPKLLEEISLAVKKDNPDMSFPKDADNLFFDSKCVIFIANDTTFDMSQIDCGLLGENIILSAWSKGIASCCLGYPIRLMKESESCVPYIEKMEFSEGYKLIYCIALGYPDEAPDAKPRNTSKIQFVE